MYVHLRFLFICIILLAISCSKTEKPQPSGQSSKKKLPAHIKKLKNLSVYSLGKDAPKKIKLVKKQVYKSNKQVVIKGYIGSVAVDDSGRVYIVGSKPGELGIYVFSSNGKYLTTISREGRGAVNMNLLNQLK